MGSSTKEGAAQAAAALAALLVLAGTGAAQTPAAISSNQNSGPAPDVGRAAELHLMNGRVVEAAHHFITAATVAQRAGKHDVVTQLAHRAEMLCNCPMMDPFTAHGIHQRIAHTGRVLVVRR